MKKILIGIVLAFLSANSWSGYNANISGKVTHVLTYTTGKNIYFRIENQPSSHPECNTDYFAIDAATPDSIRQQVLSRLLTAYTTGEAVNIGYDKEGGCSHGRIKVYRVG